MKQSVTKGGKKSDLLVGRVIRPRRQNKQLKDRSSLSYAVRLLCAADVE